MHFTPTSVRILTSLLPNSHSGLEFQFFKKTTTIRLSSTFSQSIILKKLKKDPDMTYLDIIDYTCWYCERLCTGRIRLFIEMASEKALGQMLKQLLDELEHEKYTPPSVLPKEYLRYAAVRGRISVPPITFPVMGHGPLDRKLPEALYFQTGKSLPADVVSVILEKLGVLAPTKTMFDLRSSYFLNEKIPVVLSSDTHASRVIKDRLRLLSLDQLITGSGEEVS